MAIKSIVDLLTEANVIKNAIIPSENTPNRVGSTLIDIIDSQFQFNIPQPQIEIPSQPSTPYPLIYFFDNGFSFSVNNPEIFLFRKRRKRRTVRNKDIGIITKYNGWAHPATENSAIKWNGWKYFNGDQYIQSGIYAGVGKRITEWPIPITTKPYQRIPLTTFNKYMFNKELNLITELPTVVDGNVLGSHTYYLNNTINADYSYGITGGSPKYKKANSTSPKVATYCFAVAIDNPYATKSNGLCPKIFGPYSEEFHVIWDITSGSKSAADVKIVKSTNGRLGRVVRPAHF